MKDFENTMSNVMKLSSGWIAARSREVKWSGEQLTTDHVPSLKVDPWISAVVPGTTLTTLLKNKEVPDPFYGLENQNVPDIADVGREYYTFWFYTNFQTPQEAYKRGWLHFRGINYSAEVYVNGTKYSLSKGMFLRHKLDITHSLKKGKNNLAVLVHPPDHPGRIPSVGGQGGDHDIAKDVAAQYVEGWDWIIPIRDRNTGIWDEVSVSFTGNVTLGDTHLVSSFFDKYKRAYLHITSEVTNPTSATLKCTVEAHITLEKDDLCFVEDVKSQTVSVPAGSTATCTFVPIFFYKPQLWWPNGMGDQPLYNVDIGVNVEHEGQSDTWSQQFGFRKISSFIDPTTQSRQFQVNDQPVFIRGGNWIVSDGLLRLSKERYETDVNFHADMNLNMIRVWGGALAERPEFYEACDKRGVLVWQEFWITGDCNGRGVPPSDPTWPLDHALFLECARDTVKLLRNHASLALWVGGNEQHPPDDINKALSEELKLFVDVKTSVSHVDPSQLLDGNRIYIQGSLWEGFAGGTGQFRDGPYNIQNPEDFFKDSFYAYGFNPEVGSVGVPLAVTVKATMPQEAWDIPKIENVSGGLVKELPNATWVLHTYIPYSDPDKQVPHQISMYGDASDLDDFCTKAQLVNYVQYKALMESWNSRMWTKYSGVLIWKTQNPWPGLRGQLYDHFMDQTGGFFGVKSACEPVHVQLNLETYNIEVVNTTSISLHDVALEASVWELDGKCSYNNTMKNLTLPAYKTIKVAELGYLPKQICFLRLRLVEKSGKFVSRNFYWIHEKGGDYKLLSQGEFAKKKVPVKMALKSMSRNNVFQVKVAVENMLSSSYKGSGMRSRLLQQLGFLGSTSTSAGTETAGVAFWLQFSVHSTQKMKANALDPRILPVSYSDNYFSLVPGEKMEVDISFKMGNGDSPRIILKGWNAGYASVKLSSKAGDHGQHVEVHL